MHVLDGATRYQSFLLQTGTPIGAADDAANFSWGIGDFNGDGMADLFGVKTTSTGTKTFEVHVLDSASSYQQFLLQTGTQVTQNDVGNFHFVVAPLNQGGIADVFALRTQAVSSGKLQVRILDDLDDFQSFALQADTPIDAADAAANFSWAVGDFDRDGVSDLYGIKTQNTGTGTVEVHVLGGIGAPRVPTRRVFPVGNPSGYATNVPRIVYRGTDDHIYELAISPATAGWDLFDMTGVPGAVEAAGDPMGYLGQVPRVVYRGVDNHLYELAIYPATGGWGDFDMTAATRSPPAAGDPKGFFAQTPRVVFRASTRPVFEMAIDSGIWRRLGL